LSSTTLEEKLLLTRTKETSRPTKAKQVFDGEVIAKKLMQLEQHLTVSVARAIIVLFESTDLRRECHYLAGLAQSQDDLSRFMTYECTKMTA
jgi:hypothetical protein